MERGGQGDEEGSRCREEPCRPRAVRPEGPGPSPGLTAQEAAAVR